MDESLDRTLRICRAAALTDPSTALVLARLGDWQLREGLRGLIDRRLVAGRRAGARHAGRSPTT